MFFMKTYNTKLLSHFSVVGFPKELAFIFQSTSTKCLELANALVDIPSAHQNIQNPKSDKFSLASIFLSTFATTKFVQNQ